jgi:hypothetical protein
MQALRGKTWLGVALFALAMAWMEAATVYYLRTLVGRIDPYQAIPLPIAPELGEAELIREGATLVMLFAVGWLAGWNWRTRLAYTLIAFGVWDIFYYVFLRVLTGWPKTLFDWDVLFLIPLPWWGPVVTPMSIAALMIVWGTLVSQIDQPNSPLRLGLKACGLNVVGVILALYVFMADAIRVLPQGEEALRQMLPRQFNWPLFGLAWLLMAAPVASLVWRIRQGRRGPEASATQESSHGD